MQYLSYVWLMGPPGLTAELVLQETNTQLD